MEEFWGDAHCHACLEWNPHIDKIRVEGKTRVGGQVLCKMQPNIQTTVASSGNLILPNTYYGPCTILGWIERVAVNVNLPEGYRILPLFLVPLLKIFLSLSISSAPDLLVLDKDGAFLVILLVVLEVRSTSRQGQVVSKLLKKWGSNTATTMPNEAAILVHKLPKIDPWGQGSPEGGSIVMTQRDSNGLEK